MLLRRPGGSQAHHVLRRLGGVVRSLAVRRALRFRYGSLRGPVEWMVGFD